MTKRFAVIDTETNYDNVVMSIGIVIAEDGGFQELDSKYIIIDEASARGGMFSDAMHVCNEVPEHLSRGEAIEFCKSFLNEQGVRSLFAHNASFDRSHLPELSNYEWYDIINIAAYPEYNSAIPDDAELCTTGRLKRGYGVENLLQMFGENEYIEKHNALTDARDELRIMKYLDLSITEYSIM